MNIRTFIKTHPLIEKIRNLEGEQMLLMGLDKDGNYRLADVKNHMKGQPLAVQYSSESVKEAHEKKGFHRYFLVHNHPVLESSSKHCHHFSASDIQFYKEVKNGLMGTGIELVDFYVVSKRGDYSMEDFLHIL